jgi:hypothetical protein
MVLVVGWRGGAGPILVSRQLALFIYEPVSPFDANACDARE